MYTNRRRETEKPAIYLLKIHYPAVHAPNKNLNLIYRLTLHSSFVIMEEQKKFMIGFRTLNSNVNTCCLNFN